MSFLNLFIETLILKVLVIVSKCDNDDTTHKNSTVTVCLVLQFYLGFLAVQLLVSSAGLTLRTGCDSRVLGIDHTSGTPGHLDTRLVTSGEDHSDALIHLTT